jgi:hypothetical protein
LTVAGLLTRTRTLDCALLEVLELRELQIILRGERRSYDLLILRQIVPSVARDRDVPFDELREDVAE